MNPGISRSEGNVGSAQTGARYSPSLVKRAHELCFHLLSLGQGFPFKKQMPGIFSRAWPPPLEEYSGVSSGLLQIHCISSSQVGQRVLRMHTASPRNNHGVGRGREHKLWLLELSLGKGSFPFAQQKPSAMQILQRRKRASTQSKQKRGYLLGYPTPWNAPWSQRDPGHQDRQPGSQQPIPATMCCQQWL